MAKLIWRARRIFIAAAAGMLAASLAPASAQDSKARDFKAGGITVTMPWARATPGGAKVAGAFFGVTASAGTEDKLIGASSPAAATVELHDHIDDGGVMRMRRVEAIAVKADAPVTLKPGGLHLMLMDLRQPLKAGDAVDVTLKFEKAGEVKIKAEVAPIGAAGPAGGRAEPGSGSGAGSGSAWR